MSRALAVCLAALGCAVLAGCSPHASNASIPPARYLVCTAIAGPCIGIAPKHEPSSLLMSGDGSLYAQDITWTGWGTATATGHGTAEANNCEPDCAAGTYSAHPVTITLTRPEHWRHDMVYTRAAFTVPSIDLSRTVSTGLLPESPASAASPAG